MDIFSFFSSNMYQWYFKTGVDSLKDDGTYSAHFTNFTKDGFYNVNVYATFDGKTTKIKRVSRSFGLGSSVQRYYESKVFLI